MLTLCPAPQTFDIFRAVDVLDGAAVRDHMSVAPNGSVILSVPRTRQDKSRVMKVGAAATDRHAPCYMPGAAAK